MKSSGACGFLGATIAVVVVVGCSSAATRGDDGSIPEPNARVSQETNASLAEAEAQARGSKEKAKACATYPIPVTAEPGADAEIRAGFAKLAPGSSVTVSAQRGTLSTVANMNVSLGQCPRGRNVDDRVRELVAASPDAFRMDPKEWASGFAPTCEQVSESGTLVTWSRGAIGGETMRKDVFAYQVKKAGQFVVLSFVSGTYLPVASPALANDMAGCAKLEPKLAEESVRKAKLPFETFQWCSPTGSGIYEPEARDTFALGDEYWEWDDGPIGGGVVLRRTRSATLQVFEKNHTPALIASNANCSWQGVNHIGFTLRIDAVRSALFESSPGVGCVVCAH